MTVTSTAVTLLELINGSASAQRINTVEQALSGSGIGQKNFKGTWLGYSENNRPTVRVNGRIYNVDTVSRSGLKVGETVLVRVGKNVIVGAWS